MNGKKSGQLRPVNPEFLRNIRAEQEVLGVVLWLIANDHDKLAEDVINVLRPLPEKMFALEYHRAVFRILVSLDSPETRSISYVETKAKRDGVWTDKLDSKNEVCSELISELIDKGDLTITLKTNAYTPTEFVKDILVVLERHFIEREINKKRIELSNLPLEATSFSRIRKIADEIVDATKPVVHNKTDTSAIHELLNINKSSIIEGDKNRTIVLTGFYEIDDRFGGFTPGSLVVLGARPSMGKSSLALDMAIHASRCFANTVYFSFEMPKKEMLHRVLSKETGINLIRFRNGSKLNIAEQEKINHMSSNPPYPLFIIDRNCKPVDIKLEIDKRVAELKCDYAKTEEPIYLGETGIDFVVIDYIGLMGNDEVSKYQRRDIQIGTYTSALKSIAISRNCCVFVVSQLNREIEGRVDRKPKLSDLRESGSLEQDADMVLFLDRKGREATLTVAKNRNGPTGEIPLLFMEETATFKNKTVMEDH